MPFLDDFGDIIKFREPLGPYTSLKLGGPAEALAQPRNVEELTRLIQRCRQETVPHRILGGGTNVLVRDDGMRGVVLRMNEPAFTAVEVKGNRLRAMAGAPLSGMISQAAQRALAGLESLIGIPGTVGGALRSNAGARSGYIRQMVRSVEVLDFQGQIQVYEKDDLPLGSSPAVDEAILLAAEFDLEPDDPDAILKRMRKFWIHKKSHQPLSFQAVARLFKDPRGLAADQVIEQAGLKGTRVGGAELSDRHANYAIAHPGATARDVLRLIEMVRSRVNERLGTMLQLDLVVW